MKLAINKTFINKAENGTFANINKTFENVDITYNELSNHVKDGYAFCPQIKNNWRSSSNFICSDFIVVDIDAYIQLEDILETQYIKDYCSFIYTTVHHTEDHNKFRIVFELEETILEPDEMKQSLSGISKMFGGDPSCTDTCRMFYGSKNCELYMFNKTLPKNEIDKIIEHGKESRKKSYFRDTKTNDNTSSLISNTTLDSKEAVKGKDGVEYKLDELPNNTPIHCPVHFPDENASAFTVISKAGVYGVHCMKCNTTFYTSSELSKYDFNYNLDNLKQMENEHVLEYQDVNGLISIPELPNILRTNERYLSHVDFDSDLVLVKSPKGSGKTYWLEKIVKRCKKDNKKRSEWLGKDVTTNKKWERWGGVLLIGHRRSLITSLSNRLGLKSYINYSSVDLDTKTVTSETFNEPTPYYSICVDSLSTLINTEVNWFPIIIIDEVEQVLSHLTSETVKGKRNNTYLTFKHLINSAKKIYVMDSDLNGLTVKSLHQMIQEKNRSVSLLINEYTENSKSLDLYNNENHLTKVLIDSISINERCFVCSNSKIKVKSLTEVIKQKYGDTKKVLCITSDNSAEKTIQKFISNIATEILEYDVVLCSPTLGTGLDISFQNDSQLIDCVYGFFETRVNTHFDLDQQMSRVRNPKMTRLWISPQTFRFETNESVIRKEVENSKKEQRQIISITNEGVKKYGDDEYLNLYSNVTSIQRASKNNLRNNFIDMKRHFGWKVIEVEMDKTNVDEIKELKALAKKEEKIKNIQSLLEAKLITRNEYKVLSIAKEQIPLTNKQKVSMRRYEIESFYVQDLSEELIQMDDDGKLRKQIREYELLISKDSDIKDLEKKEQLKSVTYTDRKSLSQKKSIYKNVLLKTGLMDNKDNIIFNKTIQNNQMKDFILFIKSKKQTVERIFDIDIRKDIDTKPIQQLNVVLKIIGITLDRKTKKRPDGGKDYLYSMNSKRIQDLEDISSKRKDKSIQDNWFNDRKETKENRLFSNDKGEIYDQIRDQIRNPELPEYE